MSALDENQQIIRAVLAGLVSDGKPLCVDGRTAGSALAVWREASAITRVSDASLGWTTPAPLRPPVEVLSGSVTGDGARFLAQARALRAALPHAQAAQLNATATRLAVRLEEDASVAMAASWMPPGVTQRWWGINRVRSDCAVSYQLSNPSSNAQTAFVTVQANHWGTIYALANAPGGWRVVGEWAPWMY